MLAIAFERAVEKQPPIRPQITRSTGKQAFGDAPRRDVNDVGTEYRQQSARPAAVVHLGAPCRIGQIDPQRRADIGKLRMHAPRGDALQMRVVEIARPPRDVRASAREIDDVLSGAAAGLEHVAGFAVEKFLQHRPDRLVIAMKRRRIETAIRLDRPAILAEFNNVLSHGTHPSFVIPGCASWRRPGIDTPIVVMDSGLAPLGRAPE